ncbi:MAG: surface-adhesin E family protein [Gemmatimonadaceae bacterium]
MQSVRSSPVVQLSRSLAFFATLSALPVALRAQDSWTGIGAISGTVMYMDTTTIMRDGPIRKVWVKSFDLDPKSVLAGKDTLTFDTVIGLNVFDCAKGTRSVAAVQYLLGEEIVLDVPETHDKPAPLKPNSFFAAIAADVCKNAR